MTTLYYSILASVYSSGAYSSSNYDGTNAAGTSSGSLTNTGILIGLIVGTAALLLLIAMAVRIWKRPARKSEDEANQ
jgi:hypothetical protein